MKVTGINIPKNFMDKGLESTNMSRLGDIVILAGKNGAGKTRLLKIVEECVNTKILSVKDYEIQHQEVERFENAIERDPNSPYMASFKNSLLKTQNKLENDAYFTLDARQEQYHAVRFVPNNFDFIKPSDLTESQNEANHYQISKLSNIGTIHNKCLSYIQIKSDYNNEARHQDHCNKPESKTDRQSFEKLDDLVYSFLGTRLGRDRSKCTIFNRDIGDANLSDGQKVLLQLCVLIHAQEASLNNLILILDEPENHLHPAAQIEFIKKIKEVLKNGQIWIATHSIHILSHLNTSDIWYMYDNEIRYAGKEPETVLYGLLGGKEQVERLHDFLGLPSQLAANQFAYECLFSPNTVPLKRDDKQVQQMSEIILSLKNKKGTVSILDYGAGQGRLLSAIFNNSFDLSSWLDYTAFDISLKDKEVCINALNRVYGTSDSRYFNVESDLIGNKDTVSFDIVVMCNVLHEISPKKWKSTFGQNSTINRLLADDGHLLVVEDNCIPNGELPNEDGFFILDRAELKTLFSVPVDEFITMNYREEKRLFAHLIPKKYLSSLSDDSIKDAFSILERRCRDNIAELRKRPTYKNGKLLGLLSQQLVNIILYYNR